MAYVVNADIEQRLGTATYLQLTDDNNDGIADAPVADEARLAAESEVNSYLAARYQVPIDLAVHAELAAVLKSITLDLAEYRLRLRRPPVPEDGIRRRKEAIEWLLRVSEGAIELPSAAGPAANRARGSMAVLSSETRVLSRDELEGL